MPSSSDHRPIVVTGFTPFATYTQNPSQRLVEHVVQTVQTESSPLSHGSSPLHGFVLPVTTQAVNDMANTIFDLHPKAILALGLADGSAIRIERVAVNLADFRIPDATHHQPQNQPVVEHGPAAYFSTLPTQRILQTLLHQGIPAYLSDTAGTYLCNYWLYTLLHRAQMSPQPPLVGFVHVPQTPDMIAQQLLLKPSSVVPPSMSFENMQYALNLILQEILQETAQTNSSS